jgi:choice-of-anchor A domain-containing protein
MWFSMNTPHFIVSLAVTSLLPSIALANGLGPADGFTIFTFESYQANNTDCTGRVAVGGPATYNNFGVGSSLTDSDGSRDDLIVGGTLSWNNGQSFNGNVQVVGSANMNNVGIPNGSLGNTVFINFEDAKDELQALSEALFTEPANGTTTNSWGQLNLNGDNPNLNVFYIKQSDLNPMYGMSIVVPEGSSVLVNVDHHAMHLSNFQPVLSGCDATDVLFNFPNANSVQLSSISWKGTILAPKANIQFNNGQIDGALICRTIQGNGESHHAPFDGNLPGDADDEVEDEDDRDCTCCCHNCCDDPGDNDGGHCQCSCDCNKPYGIALYD